MSRTKKTVPPRKIVAVVWDDAFFDNEVYTESQLKDIIPACRIYSTGFLAHETDDYVVVAMDFANDSTYRHVQRIRRENIREIINLS